ncbi:hypothetical protein EDD22DRAFT_902412 [Suillus occidentalis]|nr:hypothetical protein EDD22DRAFT_902412 [Suillus occidentalis]
MDKDKARREPTILASTFSPCRTFSVSSCMYIFHTPSHILVYFSCVLMHPLMRPLVWSLTYPLAPLMHPLLFTPLVAASSMCATRRDARTLCGRL